MRSDRTSGVRTKKRPSSLPPKVEMDTHLRFCSGVTSERFSPSLDASRVSEKTQKTPSNRASKSFRPLGKVRREIFLLHLVNADCHQRGPYVAAQRSRTARGIHQRFKWE